MQEPQNKVIDQGTKDLIDKLLLEKIPLAGIAKVTGVSERWLQSYVNKAINERSTPPVYCRAKYETAPLGNACLA